MFAKHKPQDHVLQDAFSSFNPILLLFLRAFVGPRRTEPRISQSGIGAYKYTALESRACVFVRPPHTRIRATGHSLSESAKSEAQWWSVQVARLLGPAGVFSLPPSSSSLPLPFPPLLHRCLLAHRSSHMFSGGRSLRVQNQSSPVILTT